MNTCKDNGKEANSLGIKDTERTGIFNIKAERAFTRIFVMKTKFCHIK